MMEILPAPLVPAHVDLRDFDFMPLDVARLRDSDLAALSTPEECWAAVLLWCASWHQVPCGSLPDNDKVLSNFAGYGRVVREWQKVRAGALRGFVKCSDGRLYHPVVAEKALDGWWSKVLNAWEKECDRLRKDNKRRKETGETELPIPPKPVRTSVILPVETPAPSAGIPAEIPLKGEGEGKGEGHINKTRPLEIDPDEKQRRFDLVRAALNIDPQDTSWGAINGWVEVWTLRGADFEADVLATVVQMMSKKPKTFTPRALNYFDETVQQNFDARVRRAEAPAPQSTLPPAPFDPETAKWEARLYGYRENDAWDSRWGPEPGQPGCKVPSQLLIQPVKDRGAA